MGKIIKKTLKSLIIFIAILLAIPAIIALSLQIPAVQTYIVNKLMGQLSAELRSSITIGRLDYEFFNKLALNDILFKDRNNDTLLYTSKLTAGIRAVKFKSRDLSFGKVTLEDPVFALITDSAGQMNLTWYLRELKKNKEDTVTKDLQLAIDRIDMKNARFALINNSPGKSDSTRSGGVNFSSLGVTGIEGVVEDLRFFSDTISMDIYELSFREKTGFGVKHLTTGFRQSGGALMFENVNLVTDSSSFDIRKIFMTADSMSQFGDFIEKVRLDIQVNKSDVSASDLRYFAPVPEGINETVSFSGKVSGTVSELRGRNINIAYNDFTRLSCDFDVSGLPDIDNSFIYLGVNNFTTRAADLAKLELPGRTDFTVPQILYRLGTVGFEGSFSGFTTDFVTYGEFTTDEGDLRTDLSLRPERANRYRVKGEVKGHSVDLGVITGSKLLGDLSMNLDVDGSTTSFEEFSGALRGTVDSVEINGYNYRNILLNGTFRDKSWDGSINIKEENIDMDFTGLVNLRDTLPEFDFTLNLSHADLHKLNIDKKDSTSSLSMLLTSNFRGNSIDNLDGRIRILSSGITRNGEKMELYDLSVSSAIENSVPALRLNTDFLNAEIRGNYSIRGLKNLAEAVSSSLMPSLHKGEKASAEGIRNDFTFSFNFRNTDKINSFFNTGLQLAENSFIRGSVDPGGHIAVEGHSLSASYRGVVMNNFELQANTADSVLTAEVNTKSVTLPGNTILENFTVGMGSEPDKFNVAAYWENRDIVLNKGKITARGSIGNGNPYLRIDIDSSEVYVSDNLWILRKSFVTIDTNTIRFNNIHISSDARFYHIDGAVSKNPADTLHMEFRGINLSALNNLTKKNTKGADTSSINMDLRGRLNGTVSLANVYDDLLLESDLTVNAFSILGSDYGDIFINSEFDRNRRVADIHAKNDLNGVRMFEADGWYDPSNKKILVDITADKLPVEALNPLLSSFASGISGRTSGKLRLSGTTSDLVMNGAVRAENVKMQVDYLRTVYTLNDSIRFDREGIRFNSVRFSDQANRQAVINGTVFHKNFRNYIADLTVTMNAGDFMVLNTTLQDNPMFYGNVFATGVVAIKTAPDLLSFDIVAKTGRNTKFFIPLSDELSVSEYSFITFIDSTGRSQKKHVTAGEKTKQLGLDINIDLTVTSDAIAEIIFDEKVGDKITGSGSGILNITLDPKGEFRITGDYEIEKGNYLFTLGNILNKQFSVENGGRISFNGDLDDAEIELRAIYSKFNTSLFPVLHDQQYANQRIPVEPQLLLSGKLFNPTVDFEINLPNSDEEIKTYLRNAISSEEELSRQFMYLLVMRSFYSEQSSYSSPSGTSAMAATTTEMLSNQLSNWISQISNDFDLGFTYRPGSGDRNINPDEVQIAFETQVLDDRVVLNGNFDYRGTSGSGSSANQLTGDFEAEVRITEKVRFKVFNRFNDQLTGKGPYTQGIGILFRQDFERLSDLIKKKNNEAKKEEEISMKTP